MVRNFGRIVQKAMTLIVPVDELLPGDAKLAFEQGVRRAFNDYRRSLAGDRRHLLEQFRYVDMARNVVGVGS